MAVFNIEDLIVEVEEATDWNNHTEARLLIAKAFKLKKYKDIFSGILQIQDAEGHLPFEIGRYRFSATNDILEHLERTQSKEIVELIKSAL